MTAELRPAVDRAAVQRRTLGVLSGVVAFAGVGLSVGITISGLLAQEVSRSDTAAGLGQTSSVLGAAVIAVPLARISDRAGRRIGLAAGYGVAVLGSVITVVAARLQFLPLLLFGLFLFGSATATALQARYAAADLAEPEHRGRSLSLVVWATTVGSVLGPNLAGPGASLGFALGLPRLGGAFVMSLAVFAVVAVGVLLLLRPDPLLLARRSGADAGQPRPVRPRRATRAALRQVWADPGGRLGVTAIVVAHAVMVGVMVMTPVHMGSAAHDEGTTLRLVGLVISVHVMGMYLFSPLVGQLADRIGRTTTVALGASLLLGAALLAGTAAPGAAVQLMIGLFLLGLGWSCCLIAGSTLVTESVPVEVRPTAQGGTDLLMLLGAAIAGAVGGPLMAFGGFGLVASAGACLIIPLAVVWLLTAPAVGQRPR